MHNGLSKVLFSTVAVALVLFTSIPAAFSQEKIVLSLDDAIRLAVKVNAEIKESEFDAEVYRDKKEQADASRWATVDLTAYGSLSPRARLLDGRDGNPESTTNINKPSYDGVFGNADVVLIQPIYTFGKIQSYRDAAGHAVKAYEAGARLKATEVELQVKEAYYGLLLGRELKGLLQDIKEQLDKSTDKVQRQLNAGAPNVDEVDLYKLQTYQGELEQYMALADQGINKAYFGLQLLTNNVGKDIEIKDQFLEPAQVNLEDYDFYQKMAMKERLEFLQLKEGLAAKKSLIKAEYADYFPQIFVAGLYSIAGATNRDHLNNPYITDEFNHSYGGAVIGFKWGLDFGIRSGRVDEAKAEYMKLQMKQLYAMGGVPFQVKDAYLQLVEADSEIKSLNGAYTKSKQWVVASLSNFDLGVGEARDIADSVSAYGKIRADYFRAIFNQRMAIANLDHATGKDASDVPYTVDQNPMKSVEKMEKDMGGEQK
ncbi:MAG: TolC family protein [Nitrospirota bacterium]